MGDLRLVVDLATVVLGYVALLEVGTRIANRDDELSGVKLSALCVCEHTAYLHNHKTGACEHCACPMFRKKPK